MKINNVAVDDLTPEQAAEIIRCPLTAAGSHTHTHTPACTLMLMRVHVNSCSLSFQRMPGRFDDDSSQNHAGESAGGPMEAPSWACAFSGFLPCSRDTHLRPLAGLVPLEPQLWM